MNDTVDVTQRATLVRVSEEHLRALRRLACATRVSQSSYLREAIGDLLAKYDHLLTGAGSGDRSPR